MTFLRDLNIILNTVLLSVVLLWLSGRLSISRAALAAPAVKNKAVPRRKASVRLCVAFDEDDKVLWRGPRVFSYERTVVLGDCAKDGDAKDEGRKQD
ncbi:uncharacterized protein JCM10292_002933 [Rhodotorula paludigena]|uniref:uncharacterized protein n=1 Tax=Rhodotorula paludigena TaxID=86838 RepID=UPI00317F002B